MKLTKKIKKILSNNGLELEKYPDLQNDMEAILIAVEQNSRALLFVKKELLADRNFIIQAVKKNGHAIRFASEELRDDAMIVIIAIKTSGCDIIKHVSQRIQNHFNQ